MRSGSHFWTIKLGKSASCRFHSNEVNYVVNNYSGNCFRASSPLFGATNIGGELMSLTAQSFVDNGSYDTVIKMCQPRRFTSCSLDRRQ